MRNRTKILIGLSGVACLAAIAAFFFFRYQLTKSFPQESGSVRISGLVAPVQISRDAYGVPRIQAANEHDALVALGFVHAQDRLWQMDMQRRAADGRLSELFGSVTLPFDRMFRIVGLRRITEEIERSLSPQSRFRLQWYSDGVNAFIAENKGKYPIEFDVLRYDPEPWQPRHSLAVARLLAWELNLSWWTDCVYGAIAEKVGPERTKEILLPYPASVPPAVPAEEWKSRLSTVAAYHQTAMEYLTFLGRSIPEGGSNAWAVSPALSATGAALLANDTHLHLSQPPQWYELQLFAPGCSVCGMSVPGIPGVVAGRNDSIAWGITNLMADDADFYYERVSDTNATMYEYDNHWLPMSLLEEEISVRGMENPVPLRIRLTRHGPVVTDISTPLTAAHMPFVASMRWTGSEIDDPIDAFYSLNRATNWQQFTEALRKFTVPGQNVIYADVRGNIGYQCAVRLPLRSQKHGLLPLPGWDPASDWKGFVPPEQLPQLFNPPEGYVASANNKTVDDSYPYYISDLWEPESRILRLRSRLGVPGEKFGTRDFETLQTDTYSTYAHEMIPLIVKVLRDSSFSASVSPRVLEYFLNWDSRFTKEDIATAIYQHFLVRLIRNTLADELGEELFHDFVILNNVPLRVIARLVKEGTSTWFDDVRTPEVETRDDILKKSLRDALADLERERGSDMRTWQWGEMHTVTLQHPFGLQKPLDKIFSIGPFPVDGGPTALVSGEYDLNKPFAVRVGASYRMIVDLGNPDGYRAVLPSGQSGQVFQRHYDDQTPLWLHGAYRTVRSRGDEDLRSTLLLVPVQ